MRESSRNKYYTNDSVESFFAGRIYCYLLHQLELHYIMRSDIMYV